MLQNSIQIAVQFKHLQSEYKKAFLFKDYQNLNENRLLSLEYEIQNAVRDNSFDKAV